MLKIALLLFKIYVLVKKKGYKQISVLGSCKTNCLQVPKYMIPLKQSAKKI